MFICSRATNIPSLPPEHLIMYLGKETSTLGITGLTFLRIASPWVGKVPPCRLLLLQDVVVCARNTTLTCTLTLLIGQRVSHSCGYVLLVCLCLARAYTTWPALTSLTNYLLCHEILEIVFVLGWCSVVCVFRARDTNSHRPPYTYLYLNKEFKSKSKWWWSVFVCARANTLTTVHHVH